MAFSLVSLFHPFSTSVLQEFFPLARRIAAIYLQQYLFWLSEFYPQSLQFQKLQGPINQSREPLML